jgi:hypothetical protein
MMMVISGIIVILVSVAGYLPAILSWELSWEPIYYSGPAGAQMDFLIPDWNAWIVERYGSVAEAERYWEGIGCRPARV